ALPVPLQRDDALSEAIPVLLTDEVTAVLAQDFVEISLRIPAEAAPDDLVYVVVAAFGVADESDCRTFVGVKDGSLVERPRIDDFARLGERVGQVPIRYRILTAEAMGDVGIAANRVLRRYSRSKFGRSATHLRAVNHAAQPAWLFAIK